MTLLMSIVVGVLFASATYFLLRRSVIKVLLGVVLLGHAVGLLIFTAGGLHRGAPPIDDGTVDTTSLLLRGGATMPADPIPQAVVILTTVIGLAFLLAVLVLVVRAAQVVESEDMDDLTPAERRDDAPGAPARRE